MKEVFLMKALFLFLPALLIGGSELLMIQETYAGSLEDLQAALPVRIMDWKTGSDDRFYNNKTIFDYIDGAGEVYRAYNMRMCLSRRYTIPKGPAIVLDIFDMGSSEDAFGVFTHDQDGEAMDVGQGALYRPGWLSFWKDRLFVSIYAEEETPATENAVRELGKAVAKLITAHGPRPRILLRLPQAGLEPRSIRYLHDHLLLNYHFYLSDENILHLGSHTDAVLAGYQRGGENALFLLIMYPKAGKAEKALASFLRHYVPEANSGVVVQLEDGKWSVAALEDMLLAVVLESDSRQLAEELIKEAKGDN